MRNLALKASHEHKLEIKNSLKNSLMNTEEITWNRSLQA